jgi:hypothetical protein
LTKVFEKISGRFFNLVGLQYYKNTDDQIDVFAIKQILYELTSEKFLEQQQLIYVQVTQRLFHFFNDMPALSFLSSDNNFLEDNSAYKILLPSLLQCNNEVQLKQLQTQLLDMLTTGTSGQQVCAIYALKEIFPDDSIFIRAIFKKLVSPWKEVRSTAIGAFRHLSLNESQINDLIAFLNKAIEKKRWISKAKSYLMEIFSGQSITGITQIERIQIIGTLCHLINSPEKHHAQFNISEEIDFTGISRNVLTTIREDLFGKAGEQVIVEQLQTEEDLYSFWKHIYSPMLFDKILNNHLFLSKDLGKDIASTLLSNKEFHIKYFHGSENRLISIPEFIDILDVEVDSSNQELLDSKDFDIADDVFETLFIN